MMGFVFDRIFTLKVVEAKFNIQLYEKKLRLQRLGCLDPFRFF